MRHYDRKTTEINVNYVIKQFNARVMIFFKNNNYTTVKVRHLAGRRRPPDPDVMPRFLNLRMKEINV